MMFTLFHAFHLIASLIGLMYGFHFGRHYGLIGGLVGMLIGGCLGFIAGRLPLRISNWFIFRQLRSESTAQLWSDLRDEHHLMPNVVLRELRRRGEPMTEGLSIVLSMLTADDRPQRLRGFAAFLSNFPELSGGMKSYNPDASDVERREAVNELKLFVKAAPKLLD